MSRDAGQALVVAVFDQDRYARSALRLLYEDGLNRRQVGYVARHGELLEAVGTLGPVDVPEHDLVGGLIGFGVPVSAARELSAQFDRGCAIITVETDTMNRFLERELYLAGAVSVARWAVHLPHAAESD